MVGFTKGLGVYTWILISLAAASAFADSIPNFEVLDRPTGRESAYYLYINLNTSQIELSHFRDAAKKNGYGFVMVPGTQTLDAMASDYNHYIDNRCDSHETKLCRQWDSRLVRAADAHSVDLYRDIPAALNAISGAKVAALVISGHNSDGGFSGDYLVPDTFAHEEIAKLLGNQKDVFADTSFLGLWGCDSITLDTTQTYTRVMPGVKLIAGFGDTAPSGIRPVSGTFLESTLESIDSLSASATPSVLSKRIASMDSVQDVFGALWVKTADSKSYIYRHSEDGSTIEDVNEICQSYLKQRFPRDREIVEDYYDGALAIPTDAPGSPLRDAYYSLTEHSLCYNQENFLSPVQIGMLRFFDSVKKNFTLVFGDLMSPATKAAILRDDRVALKSLSNQLVQNKTSSENDKKLGMLVNRYLLELDDDCFDFLLWHEKRDAAPKAFCTLDDRLEWIVKR